MFHGWDNFYYMVGSAAAGLIGLLFVVVTLTAGFDRDQAQRGQALYMNPTMATFAVVFTLSAAAVAPGLPPRAMAIVLGVGALLGLAIALNACVGIARPRKGMPVPHWSDVWLYGVLPAVLYAALVGAAVALWSRVPWAVHAIAALLIALLLSGIRNAWDLVTWIAPVRKADGGQAGAPGSGSESPS